MNSKEILEATGISRATLNNYISWGIVAKPEVLPPGPQDGAAPRIGYFPDETITRIAEIQRLKRQGWSMTRIAEHFGAAAAPARASEIPEGAATAPAPPIAGAERGSLPRLSVDENTHPAYFVNHRFELIWFNAAAEADVLRQHGKQRPDPPPHSVFRYLLGSQSLEASSRETLLAFHVALARQRGLASSELGGALPAEQASLLQRLYGRGESRQPPVVSQASLSSQIAGAPQPVCVHAVEFREGTLFVYVAGRYPSDDVSALLAHGEMAAGEEGKRLPVLRHVAVLAADLQHPNRIWSELPADEYFELIDQIWLAVDPIFRRHHGTHGKHAGDGLVGYFFPQRESSYAWNALAAAHEVREAMRRISKSWQLRKSWSTELYMNTGVAEGQQWVATPRSAGQLEFTMLGDVLHHAARLSDFARCGAVWATKSLFAKLTGGERQRLKFGVRRKASDGRQVFVHSVFSTIERLGDPATGVREGLKDIARLPITEVVEVGLADRRRDRSTEQDQN